MKVIQQAAIRLSGIVYKGKRHKEIMMSIPKHLDTKGREEGFVTSQGLFVDRKEAAKLASMFGQIKGKPRELKSEHLY
jgi:hypothetical protein